MPLAARQITEMSWSDLRSADKKGIEGIYRDSFPPEERRPLEAVIAGSRLWIVRSGNDLLGFATVATFAAARSALLQYLAVAPPERSTGVGSQLLEVLAADLAREGSVDGILIEIEDPFDGGVSDEARRRLRFYRSCGADRLGCLRSYFMADFAQPGRIPMMLLWRPLTEAEPPAGTSLRAALHGIFESEYSEVADQTFLADLLAEVIC